MEDALDKARKKAVLMNQVYYVLPLEQGDESGRSGFEIETVARFDAVFVIEPVGSTKYRMIDRRNRDRFSRAVA